MTKLFDDKARQELKNSINYSLNWEGQKPKEMKIFQISVKEARGYIATYHYSQSMPDSTKYVFAGFYGNTLAGIIVYGMGAGKSQYKALIPDIKTGQYIELTRLWSPDGMPKNTESRLIGKSIKMLPKEIQIIVSFADPFQNHKGTIYQATNFYYCGETSGGKSLVTLDGHTQHTRLIGIYKKRHPELKDKKISEIMEIYGWSYKENSGKYRYVFLRGKNKKYNFEKIKDKIIKYPKI